MIRCCRAQADRIGTLAEQCSDRNIRDQVEAMAKNWADMAYAKEDRSSFRLLSF
jgi:hypothetical protein